MLERNLAALRKKLPAMADRIMASPPDTGIGIEAAKSGDPVPIARRSGDKIGLHSRVDPAREGERLAGLYRENGFIVAVGMGGGYHLRPLLARGDLSALWIAEQDPGHCRAVWSGIDVSDILSDSRVRLFLDDDPATIASEVAAAWVPMVHGNMAVLPLRARIEGSPRFESLIAAVHSAMNDAAADLATQARFGKRWFANALRNALSMNSCAFPGPAAKPTTLVVAAAGPSLEDQSAMIRAAKNASTVLLATDASMPMLLGRGIAPDAAVSIDCQHYTLYHFYGTGTSVPLILDLSSPPALARGRTVMFTASAHPFSRYLAARVGLVPIDTSGGNVTHAAVSLGPFLGAREIAVYGADFSCPRSKAYARNSWIDVRENCGSTRFSPDEHRGFSRSMRPDTVKILRPDGKAAYQSALFARYRARLRALLASISGDGGFVETWEQGPIFRAAVPDKLMSASRDRTAEIDGASMRRTITDYRSTLASVEPVIADAYRREIPARGILETLDREQCEAFLAVLPAAASFAREGSAAIWSATKWSLEVIDRIAQ